MRPLPPGIHVVEHGPADAPLVILVHGAPDRSRSFQRALQLLTDLHTVVYDRRGYGASLAAAPAATCLADHVTDLVSLIDGRPATVVGHSFGSNVAMGAAVQRPDLVVSLGLWEPPMPWLDWWPAWARRAVAEISAHPDSAKIGERAFKTMVGRPAWDAFTDDQRELCRAEGAAFLADMGSQVSAPFDLGALKVPGLVGYGSNTWEHQVDGAIRLADLIGAELVVLEGDDHFAHVSDPEGFAGFVRRAVALGREA